MTTEIGKPRDSPFEIGTGPHARAWSLIKIIRFRRLVASDCMTYGMPGLAAISEHQGDKMVCTFHIKGESSSVIAISDAALTYVCLHYQ